MKIQTDAIKGVEPLLSEDEAIRALGLHHRPNPKASIRWLVRTGRLQAKRVTRSVFAYPVSEVRRFIASL
jgi:hypothetical protein